MLSKNFPHYFGAGRSFKGIYRHEQHTKTKPMPNYSKTDPIESNNMALTRHTHSVTLAIFKNPSFSLNSTGSNSFLFASHNSSVRFSYAAHSHGRHDVKDTNGMARKSSISLIVEMVSLHLLSPN